MDDQIARDVVRSGYDRIAERYTAWALAELSPGRRHALSLVDRLIPNGARVLELGCGAGVPMTAALAARYDVLGVDLSERQIALARQNVPQATFLRADVVDLDFPAATFDASVAFYSLTHVPREHHAPVLRRIHGWLRPGGVFIASLGTGDDPGTVQDDWLGAPMYFSHFDASMNIALVHDAGFDIVSAETVVEPEDDGYASFLWIGARRP